MNPKIRVRISDNVLGDEDFNIYELEFEKRGPVHVVVAQRLEQSGVYGQDFLGMIAERVRDWAAFDPTGSHPEVWHEIWDPRKDEWVSLISTSEFLDILGLEEPKEKKSQTAGYWDAIRGGRS